MYRSSTRRDGTVPLLRANGFPTACSHREGRSLEGMPFHQRRRRPGLIWTTRQSGTISLCHTGIEYSTLFSRSCRRARSSSRRFSAGRKSVRGTGCLVDYNVPATRLCFIMAFQSLRCLSSSVRGFGGRKEGRVLLTTLSRILGPAVDLVGRCVFTASDED